MFSSGPKPKEVFLSFEKRDGNFFSISKHYLNYEKFYLQISSSIVHKIDLFLDPNFHYLSKKQPKTYSFRNGKFFAILFFM